MQRPTSTVTALQLPYIVTPAGNTSVVAIELPCVDVPVPVIEALDWASVVKVVSSSNVIAITTSFPGRFDIASALSKTAEPACPSPILPDSTTEYDCKPILFPPIMPYRAWEFSWAY